MQMTRTLWARSAAIAALTMAIGAGGAVGMPAQSEDGIANVPIVISDQLIAKGFTKFVPDLTIATTSTPEAGALAANKWTEEARADDGGLDVLDGADVVVASTVEEILAKEEPRSALAIGPEFGMDGALAVFTGDAPWADIATKPELASAAISFDFDLTKQSVAGQTV